MARQIHVSGKPHSWILRATFMNLECHIQVSGAPHSCIWRATFMYLARHIHVFGSPSTWKAAVEKIICTPDSCIWHARFMYLARHIHVSGAPNFINASARQRSVKGFYGHPFMLKAFWIDYILNLRPFFQRRFVECILWNAFWVRRYVAQPFVSISCWWSQLHQ